MQSYQGSVSVSSSTSMNGQRTSKIVNHSVPQPSPVMQRKRTEGGSMSTDHGTTWSGIEGKKQRT